MDKIISIIGVVCAIIVIIIGFAVKPLITAIILLIIAVVGWHDDYYLPRTHR